MCRIWLQLILEGKIPTHFAETTATAAAVAAAAVAAATTTITTTTTAAAVAAATTITLQEDIPHLGTSFSPLSLGAGILGPG